MTNWEIFEILSTALGLLTIPVVIAIIGNKYSKSIKERELQGKFVELAVAMLNKEPNDESKNIRAWATKIINLYSEVELGKQAQTDLIEKLSIFEGLYSGVVLPEVDSDNIRIEDHFLVGGNTRYDLSPNTSGRLTPSNIDTILIHYTAGDSLSSAVKTLTNPKIKASTHIIIDRDGRVIQIVPFNFMSWSAGRSEYKGKTGFNNSSISIELVNAGVLEEKNGHYTSWFGKTIKPADAAKAVHKHGKESKYWQTYTSEQVKKCKDICKLLVQEFDISFILGHDDVSKGRKVDPGPMFPMEEIQTQLLGRKLD